MAAFTLENDVFRSFAMCGSACVAKMMLMGPLTVRQRFKHQAFANLEDNPKMKVDQPKIHGAVERVRRCHLNDLENITPFLALGALYLTIGPDATIAVWHFRVFAISRFLHTICYLNGIQPFRALCYLVGTAVNVSMVAQVLHAVFTH